MKNEKLYRGHIPFVRFLAFFLAGIVAGYLFEPNLTIYRALALCCAICFLLFVLIHLIDQWRVVSFYLGIFFLLGMFVLGWMLLWKNDPKIQKSHFSHFETEALVGIVIEEPKYTGEYLRCELKIHTGIEKGKPITMTGLLLINFKVDTLIDALKYGDLIVIPANYYEISPPYNLGDFNYKTYLANNNIWHSSFLENHQFKKIGEGKGNYTIQYAITFRHRMLRKFEHYLTDRSVLSIASALVLGYRNDMEKEVLNVFTDTGTVHVLSVSGLHVGIVFVVFSALLFWMNRNPKIKFVKGIVLIVLIWLYALITGFSPSVLRAAIMISFTLIAFHFVRNRNIYNTIAASALMLLFYNPKFISNIGFQLSYLAVIAIIYLYPKIRDLFAFENRVLRWIWSYSALSIAAQLITFPLVIYYFNNFPLYFLPANLFIITPATFIVYLGLALLFVPAGLFSSLIANALQGLILFSKGTLKYLAHLPFASISGLSINSWQVFLIYVLMLSFVFALTLKKKQLLYWGIAAVILLATSRVQKHLYSKDITQFRFYNVNRNLAIGIFQNDEHVLYTDSVFVSSKSYQFLLGDIELEKGKGQVRAVTSTESYRSPNILIEKDIIQLKNKRVFIYDKTRTFKGDLVTDILLIRNNVNTNLENIQRTVKFKKLLIDGSNSDKNVEKYIQEAKKLSIPFYVLKNNFAYVW